MRVRNPWQIVETLIDSDSLASNVVAVVEEGIRESSIAFVGTGDGVGVLAALISTGTLLPLMVAVDALMRITV